MGIPEAGAMGIGIWEASQVCRRVTVYSTGPDSLTYNIDIPEPAVLHITRAWRTILTYQSLAYYINLPEPGVLYWFTRAWRTILTYQSLAYSIVPDSGVQY